MEQAKQDIEDWLQTARQILGILTRYPGTQEAYDRERNFMLGYDIPASSPDPEVVD